MKETLPPADFDLSQTFPLWERGERSNIHYPPPLTSVGIAVNAIENYGYVPESQKLYIEANSRTQAFEAVAPGVVMTTFQAWDGEKLVAFGNPTEDIYRNGLMDIVRLREKYGENINFEEARRVVEYTDAHLLNEAVASGIMDTKRKVVISPYPIGADKNTAREIGYFSEKAVAMIRTYDFDPASGLMEVDQIAVENTNLEAINGLVAFLNQTTEKGKLSSSEILGEQIFIPKDKLKNGVLDLARMYDRILEGKNKERYFLGRKTNTNKDYIGIKDKTREARQQTERIVDHLVDMNIEVAKSLVDETPTVPVRQALILALQSSSGSGLIDDTEKGLLVEAQFGKFGMKNAEALINFVTKNDYLAMLCLTNPDRAEQIFDAMDVKRFKENYLADPSSSKVMAPPVLPSGVVELYFCGSMMKIAPVQSPISGMSLPVFGSFLREDAGDGKGPLEFQANCGHWNTRPFGSLLTHCKRCGTAIQC